MSTDETSVLGPVMPGSATFDRNPAQPCVELKVEYRLVASAVAAMSGISCNTTPPTTIGAPVRSVTVTVGKPAERGENSTPAFQLEARACVQVVVHVLVSVHTQVVASPEQIVEDDVE